MFGLDATLEKLNTKDISPNICSKHLKTEAPISEAASYMWVDSLKLTGILGLSCSTYKLGM